MAEVTPTDKIRWSEAKSEFLARADAVLASSSDYEQNLVALARLAVPVLGDWCTVALLGRDGKMHRLITVCEDPGRQQLAEAINALPILADVSSSFSRVMASGVFDLLAPIPADYFDRYRDAAQRRLLLELAPCSILTIPLVARGSIQGAIAFTMAESRRRHDAESIALAHELARRVAVAVDSASLFRDTQRRLAELATVQRVAQAITSALRLDEICRTVVQQIHTAFGYRLISIYLRQGDALHLQAEIGYASVLEVIRIDQGVSGRVVRTGQAAFVQDAHADPDFIAVESRIRQGIIVPLHYGGGPVLGTISVESDGDPRLTDDDLSLLSLLADQISVAVVNARLFARVEESANRFRSLVETAGAVIFCLDPGLHVTEYNREAERVFGRRREDVLGYPFLERLVPEHEHAALIRICRPALAGEPVPPFEWPVHCADGMERSYVWAVVGRLDAAGAPVELFVVGQDISVQREAEQARLAMERKMLETQRLESLGLLAGGIAHDFNNLLAAILGNASLLLLDLPQDSEAYHSARQIELVSQRAADLVGQMLAYAGRGRFVVQSLSLNELVTEMIVLLRVSISKGAALVQRLTPRLPPIEADAAQMRQVVMNLIVNASEALGDSGGTITIATGLTQVDRRFAAAAHLTPDLAPGSYVSLHVEDSGAGMDSATLGRIFDPFFTTKFTGRGLGLAAVLGIVRAHRGGLLVESRPGHGSRFTVLLPIHAGASAGEATALAARHGAALSPEVGSPLVLVIDDEDDVRRTTARILERGGYIALSAADGEGALGLARSLSQPIAAVLLDLTMPGLSGEQVFSELRRLRPEVPIVVVSGYAAEEVTGRFSPDQPAAFLQKPFGAGELLALLRRVLAPT